MTEYDWYNFRTGVYDHRGDPQSDDEARDYMPQVKVVQLLYRLYRDEGASIIDALCNVGADCLGLVH